MSPDDRTPNQPFVHSIIPHPHAILVVFCENFTAQTLMTPPPRRAIPFLPAHI